MGPGQVDRAYAAHLDEVARLKDQQLAGRLAQLCGTPYPLDFPTPGYLGTRCTKGPGHAGPHGILLSGVRMEWT
jgi:hypothetical protein